MLFRRIIFLLILLGIPAQAFAATAVLLPNGKQQFVDANGAPYAGGSVYFYVPNTSTPKTTWQDSGEATPNANPVILDSAGRALIYGSGQYREVLQDSLGNTVWDTNTQDVYGLVIASNDAFTGNNTFAGTSIFNGNVTFNGTVTGLSLGALASLNIGTGLANDGSSNLVPTHPTTAQTGTNYTFTTSVRANVVVRSNSAVAMADSVPGTSGALPAGWFSTLQDNDTVSDTLSVGAGGSIALGNLSVTTLTIQPGEAWNIVSLGSGSYRVFSAGTQVVYNNISGGLPTAISGTNTTAAVTISAGRGSDSTNTTMITAAQYSWAVSNGNAINGFQGGTTLPNSTTIHFFWCSGSSGVGSFASTSTTPTCPTGYNNSYRRIFSILTSGAGALLTATPIEIGGGAIQFWYNAGRFLDINTTTLSTTAVLSTLTVPQGIKVQVINTYYGGGTVLVTSPDEQDQAPQAATAFQTTPGFDTALYGTQTAGPESNSALTTNTSGQIRIRANAASTSMYFYTRGYIDFRRN